MSFYQLLKTYINASVVGTPRSISVSCGLSIKTEKRNLNTVLDLLRKTRVDNLIGIFLITSTNNYNQVEKIY